MNIQDFRLAVETLRGASIKPRCSDHHPEEVSPGKFQCPNCYFTLYDLTMGHDAT